MTVDQIEQYGDSLLQHGTENDRVYLMKLQGDDLPEILDYIDELVEQNDYSKIFVKIPATKKSRFEQAGYHTEAMVPNFYKGAVDGLFMARYPQPERQDDPDAKLVAQVLQAALDKATPAAETNTAEDSSGQCRLALPGDCKEMAALYQRVFRSYPFPIQDPEYLRKTMDEHVVYAGTWRQGKLVALASAEVDTAAGHAEMTDFATDPAYRGQGLAHLLLAHLEELMAKTGVKTCYTIARATSFGMNITFARSGYQFAGTLVQNTQISGGLESMNVWYKPVCL